VIQLGLLALLATAGLLGFTVTDATQSSAPPPASARAPALRALASDGGCPAANPPPGKRVLQVQNLCQETVWPGIIGPQGIYIPPPEGGWELQPGTCKNVVVDSSFPGMRVWPRTGCDGKFSCVTGGCTVNRCVWRNPPRPSLSCGARRVITPDLVRSAATGGALLRERLPVSLFEATLQASGSEDFYDTSLVGESYRGDQPGVCRGGTLSADSWSVGLRGRWLQHAPCREADRGRLPADLRAQLQPRPVPV
jgi:hypothetical protein